MGEGTNAAYAGLFWKILIGSRLDITNKLMFGRTTEKFSYRDGGEEIRVNEESTGLMWSIGVGYPIFIRRTR